MLSSVAITFKNVDFPEPESPVIPRNSPESMSRFIPAKTFCVTFPVS